jgi:hypothetical protein
MKNVYLMDGSLIPTKYEYTKKGIFRGVEIYTVPNFRMVAATGYKVGLKGLTRIIVVSSKFNKLTRMQKMFVLLHEIGHYECGHFDEEKNGRVISLEIEADIYACDALIAKYGITPNEAAEVFVDVVNTLHLNKREAVKRYNGIVKHYKL